jgi:hypothetical protein
MEADGVSGRGRGAHRRELPQVVAIIAALAGAASAGPNDDLQDFDPCQGELASDAKQLVLPEADGVRHPTAPPSDDDEPSGGASRLDFETKGKVVSGTAGGKDSGPSWCAETVQLTIDGKLETLIFSGIYARYSDPDDVSPMATQWALPMADADASAAAKAGTLAVPAPAAAGADTAPDASAVIAGATSTKKLAALAAPKLVVVGSAEGQLWQGAKAKKVLGKWNLDLAVDPHVTSGADDNIAWVIANVTATPHKKGAPAITYRVLYGLYRASATSKKWKVALVHFALVKP